MSEKARLKMIKARSELVLDHPFFAELAMRLDMREDPSCQTAWSDGRTLAYNPSYIEGMPLEKVKGLQCHEVLHLACCHHTRRNGRDEKLWNTACDYAINPVLLEAGIELPHGYLDDPAHHGKSAEAVYKTLVDREEEKSGSNENNMENEVESQDAESQSAAQNSDDENSLSNEQNDTRESSEEQAADDNDPGGSGEVRDAPSLADGNSEDGRRREEDEWKESLAQALNKSRESGTLPGTLERLMGEMLAPSVSWRELLRRFLAEAAKNDFSWVRPDRRRLHAGLYLPSLHNEELAEVAVAVDVSGSIDQSELDAFAAELSAVLEEFDTAITVFTCDAALTTQERLAKWDLPLNFQAKGGGGTSFRPPFEKLEEDDIQPACFVYFTDMACTAYPEDPGYPVLWVTPAYEHTPPPFGEVILMEPC
jgi:predicted metal-dependent peptidase